MLSTTRKLRISFALSPELTEALDNYAVSFGVSRSAFTEEGLWIYLNQLDKHMESKTKTRFQNEDALAA
ncbi:hypothetical protein [Microcoleus sp. B4-D4]|uniref:hypothetical protein n=1 Tax=unclassified Microcoleus TaxID=2642155 RepID=UPI002FD51E12